MPPANANETYCTFTLASDVTAGGLPSEDEIAKDLESNDTGVSSTVWYWKPVGLYGVTGMTMAVHEKSGGQ